MSSGYFADDNTNRQYVSDKTRAKKILGLLQVDEQRGNCGMATLTLTEKTTAKTGFTLGGVTCKPGAFRFYLSSALVDSFVLLNLHERKARKRFAPSKIITLAT